MLSTPADRPAGRAGTLSISGIDGGGAVQLHAPRSVKIKQTVKENRKENQKIAAEF